jgi:NitT/TauT family transport system ATP-binding protein
MQSDLIARKVTQPALREGRIELRGVTKSYGAGRFVKRVVENCSFSVEGGKFTVMIGPSGVGKSTIIRLLAGFEKATSGEILINGKPVRGPGRDRLVVFQETALFPWMTTRENILYGPKARGEEQSQARRRADGLLERTGLQAFRNKYPAQLSGGMQRRAELARAMINDPTIIILDEPFRGLDAMTKNLMLEYYATLFEDTGRTNLFITTDIGEAIFLADRLLIMSHIPTCVREVIDVDLPRPRALADIVDSDQANDIKARALSVLYDEAMKSFASGSRATSDFVDAYIRRMTATGPT